MDVFWERATLERRERRGKRRVESVGRNMIARDFGQRRVAAGEKSLMVEKLRAESSGFVRALA